MPFSYYVGLDLGQSQDYTALTVVEEPVWVPTDALRPQGWAWQLNIGESGWVPPSSLSEWQLEQALSVNYHYGRPPEVSLKLEIHPRSSLIILLSSGSLAKKLRPCHLRCCQALC